MRKLVALLVALVLLVASPIATLADTFGQLKGKQFGAGGDLLVVFLHGDISRGGPADYLYRVARKTAASHQNVTAVALLRPGYHDSDGQKSAGSNFGKRDQYTKGNNDLVAHSIQEMVRSIDPRRVIVVGHSGGAAQLGAIIGRYPDLVDSAVLVSCPCDIARWRKLGGHSEWPRSQSPIRYIRSIGRTTRVVAVTGNKDNNTVASIASEYIEAAKAVGVSARFVLVPGANHSFSTLENRVIGILKDEIQR